jgi:tetratricopeptide (TPR) repeat protein
MFFAGAMAQDKQPDSKRLYEQGEAAFNAGNYQQALVLFDQCLKTDPGFTEAYFIRAATREQLKDLAGAFTDYSIYVEMKPENPEARLSRGTVAYRLGRYAQAKEDFTKLLSLPPGETNTVFYRKQASTGGTRQIMTAQGTALRAQLYNYLGLTETKLKNHKAAVAWLDSAIAVDGKEADYYVNRGIAKEAMGDTTALRDYKRALTIHPDHALAQHNIAVLKRKKGEKSDSGDRLEKAIESDSSMLYPYLERAYQRLEGGYYKGALEDYNRALELETGDPEIWLNRGLVREKLNDLKGAYSDYTKAIALKEDYDKAWLNRGNVLNKQGKYKEAIEDYTIALLHNPDYASAFYNRAIARHRNDQHAEACEDLKKAEALGMTPTEKMRRDICE